MPQLNDDGSIWHIDEEIEKLLVVTADESERRGADLVGEDDPMYALGNAAGFDAAVIARLVRVCAYQQRRIEELEGWVERQGRD